MPKPKKERPIPDDPSRQALRRAGFSLLADTPWPFVTLESLARRSGHPLRQVQRLVPEKEALIPFLLQSVSAETKRKRPRAAREDSPQDRLFDHLMTRFEILQAHKPGICALAPLARRSPPLALALYRAERAFLAEALAECCWPRAPEAAQGLRLHAVMAAYALAFARWLRDSSPDQGPTMAALDQALRYALTKEWFS